MGYSKTIKSNIQGEWRDIIYNKDGTKIVKPWEHNIIVNSINVLIASLMKNSASISGITHWAVGSGLSSWDSLHPNVLLDETATTLVNEIGRVPISSIVFIDSMNTEVSSRTNRILVTAIFEASECLGSWREFALFGGDATSSINTGIMIDHKEHELYLKNSDVKVQRQIRFIFE